MVLSPRFVLGKKSSFNLDHVMLRYAFSDAYDERHFSFDCFYNSGSSAWRWYIDNCGSCIGLLFGLFVGDEKYIILGFFFHSLSNLAFIADVSQCAKFKNNLKISINFFFQMHIFQTQFGCKIERIFGQI